MTEPERAARQGVLEALATCSDRNFLLIISAANGLLQTVAMEDPPCDVPVLDAVLLYLRTKPGA